MNINNKPLSFEIDKKEKIQKEDDPGTSTKHNFQFVNFHVI